jgi:capsular polysaccharide biosynthesis protein
MRSEHVHLISCGSSLGHQQITVIGQDLHAARHMFFDKSTRLIRFDDATNIQRFRRVDTAGRSSQSMSRDAINGSDRQFVTR